MPNASRVSRAGLFALAACFLLTDCDSGGSAPFPLFFGATNKGRCNDLSVDVELGDAVLARQLDGSVDCGLDDALATLGCDSLFEELEEGSTLRVTIANCDVPEVSNLFHCVFTRGDASQLARSWFSHCSCADGEICPGHPQCFAQSAICVATGADPFCEICDNLQDDDGDGAVDCADVNCDYLCNIPISTTSCTFPSTTVPSTTNPPSTTETSTTEPQVTTTSVPVEGWSILFTLDTASAPLGALQWSIDYSAADGEFQGSGASVVCANEVPGALFAPNDNDAGHVLTLGLIALSPFAAPANLVHCTFLGPTPSPADFQVTIEDATDVDGNAATAVVGVITTFPPVP